MDYDIKGGVDYNAFHALLIPYYREGEDKDTPQEQIDGFIQMLFNLVQQGKINCRLLVKDGVNIGFVLWAIDTEDFDFSELPGMGTILEIGIQKPHRHTGAGTQMVQYVENQLRQSGIRQCYVSAYGPAQTFWKHCDYQFQGLTASNGLPLMVKTL